ncbi:MAG: alpha/beta fold hydrolase, partial [Rhodobacteraceae bacterium]|nr:alpha/beta fold hydrolase [Paracoccaceae bacterium]
MKIATLDGINLHYRIDGNPNGKPVVFANSLGTDLRLWDAVLPLLPRENCYIRYDKRGHGLSQCPPAPYSMGALVRDVEQLMDHLGVTDALFVGLSIGGMIAQGLAVKRLDLVRAMVLSNTAAKIGQPEMWQSRIDAVRKGGIASLSDAVMERWFGRDFHATADMQLWKAMLERQPAEGYIGCSAAISGTDFYTPTSG